jgi:hypothetical protein
MRGYSRAYIVRVRWPVVDWLYRDIEIWARSKSEAVRAAKSAGYDVYETAQ